MPVKLLRRVGLILNFYRDGFAFLQAKQRARKLAIVGRNGDDAIGSEFDGLDGDGEGIVGRCVGWRWSLVESRLLDIREDPWLREDRPRSDGSGCFQKGTA